MQIIEFIFFLYCGAGVFYAFILALMGRIIPKRIRKFSIKNHARIALLIPAYKEDSVIVSTAKKALEQDYSNEYYEVVVIADSLQPATLKTLKTLPITVIEVAFPESTKTKALNKAMETIGDDYDIGIILDADNIMEQSFLKKINQAYQTGYKVIQGERVAKNMNTSFAILDALSEIINNHIYRRGHFALNLSCGLIGSGMAFDYSLLKTTLSTMDAIGGFDRELEYRLIEKGHKAVYLKGAKVLDEKVDNPDRFSKQRKRWIASQFFYLRNYFKKGFAALLKGNLSYFNSTILRNLFLPRVILLGVIFISSIISYLFMPWMFVPYYGWLILLTLNLLAFVLSVPLNFYNKRFFQALLTLPKAFFIMFLLLFKLKGANKNFIHTPHGSKTS